MARGIRRGLSIGEINNKNRYNKYVPRAGLGGINVYILFFIIILFLYFYFM